MNERFRPLRLRFALTALSVLLASAASAQSPLRRDVAPPLVSARQPEPPKMADAIARDAAKTTVDYIVAVVNQEPVTHTDINKRVARLREQLAGQSGARMPSGAELRQQVLDSLIDERVQVSYAKASGVDVSEAELDNTIEGIAAQNQLTMVELRQRMVEEGMDYGRYRTTLREQLVLQRLREREVNARIQISESDIDNFLKNDPSAGAEPQVNLAHILVAVPENANAMEIQALRGKALDIQQQAAKGGDFAQLASEFSDDSRTRKQGGAFGLRPISRLPELFLNAANGMKVGQVSQVLRTNAGFHILKLVDRQQGGEPTYTQQHARHILLRLAANQSPDEALAKLKKVRDQIVGGASFEQMARQYSEDGSAPKGGDLGWASPGQFVPEFEKTMSGLQPGEVSQPMVSRFGVHLIQLVERREVKLSDAQKREAARNVLKERRFESAYEEWARELRGAAWIEVREAP
ncbi:MAG: hypothetical protein RI907_1972 [Pseudomonadota bacterium]|jgi:peptidyl-prolyl cis-trans isomerase SurA